MFLFVCFFSSLNRSLIAVWNFCLLCLTWNFSKVISVAWFFSLCVGHSSLFSVCFFIYIVCFCWILGILNNIATFPTLFQIKSVPLWKSSEICFVSVSPSGKNLSSMLQNWVWRQWPTSLGMTSQFFRQSAGLGQQPLVFSVYLSCFRNSGLWVSWSEGDLGPIIEGLYIWGRASILWVGAN